MPFTQVNFKALHFRIRIWTIPSFSNEKPYPWVKYVNIFLPKFSNFAIGLISTMKEWMLILNMLGPIHKHFVNHTNIFGKENESFKQISCGLVGGHNLVFECKQLHSHLMIILLLHSKHFILFRLSDGILLTYFLICRSFMGETCCDF